MLHRLPSRPFADRPLLMIMLLMIGCSSAWAQPDQGLNFSAPQIIQIQPWLHYADPSAPVLLAATLGVLGTLLIFSGIYYGLTRDRSFSWFALYVLAAMVLIPVAIIPGLLSDVAVVFLGLSGLGTTLWRWQRLTTWRGGNPSARNFAVAWAMLILFGILHIMVSETFLPSNLLTQNSLLIGLVAHVLLLSFAMADRHHRELLDRERTQSKTLEAQRLLNREREIQLQAQANQLKRQTEKQLHLEQRMTERTEALVRALKDLKTANQELSRLSTTDSLTRLNNRRYFDELLEKEFERAKHHHYPISLILIDIDHLREFNEAHGHLVGDDCLRLVAASLQDVVTRKTDLLARFGGDEFAVALLETREEDALLVAERLRKHVNSIKFINRGQKLTISASLGIAGAQPAGGDHVTSLINAAEAALHLAKNEGRNRSMRANLTIRNQIA